MVLKALRACPPGKRPGGRARGRYKDYMAYLAWECLGMAQEELESIAGERDVWVSSWTCCLGNSTWDKCNIMDGWMK